jgi:hypothetical protein
MTDEQVGTPTFAELDALPTEELRERAFKLAWHHHDLGFFKDVIEHLPAAEDTEQLDGSVGSFSASLSDIVSLWREFTGHGYGEDEPLLRAAFIDYLMKN